MDSETLLRGIQLTQSQIDERTCHLTSRSRMQLKLFVNENTFSEKLKFYFIKNQTTSLRIRLFKFSLKLCTVILYLIRVGYEDSSILENNCCGMCTRNFTNEMSQDWIDEYNFSWNVIVWVQRPFPILCIQVILAIIGFLLEVVNTFATYKGNLSQQLISLTWIFELICSVPFIVTIFWEPLRCLYIPVFLNIWLAKAGLESIINDLHRVAHKQQSAMFNQVVTLLSTLLCLFVTCICGVQHLERAGKHHIDLFDAFWFVVVTFSTVGYGDITPTIWPSRLLVIVIIFVALSIIPSQLEQISFLYSERQKQGGEYSRQRAKTEKHVVVCATVLRMDVILDFLNEFYAHPVLQNFYVVLLSPVELDGPLKRFLQIPIWAERVIFIQGSVLKDIDLLRVKMDAAEACFILTSRQEVDRVAADEKTILRAMAVKDFAPSCPLYVQILRPESMIHVQFADRVICDEELKHVLLAMNSYIPGISTLITLLAHTSKGEEGKNLNSKWKREFGRSAGNEIYSIEANESKFFGGFVGYKFNIASLLVHSKYGATLFAVERAGEIRLNPGSEFTIDQDDTLFYICLTQEEDAKIVEHSNDDEHVDKFELNLRNSSDTECSRSMKKFKESGEQIVSSVASTGGDNEHAEKSEETSTTMGRTKIDFPPTSPYVGHSTPSMCHILEEKAKLCCLRLDRSCEHCFHTSASLYNWSNPPIIVSAEFAPPSLFNVMVPLRAYYRPKSSLHPIILLLEHSPDNSFLNAISCFPMVYYMLGGMNDLDSLLIAGVLRAHTVIIIDRETSMYADEEYMADSRQLVATQTMFRLFPTIPTCLELTHSTNMRFMHFTPPDMHIDAGEFRKEREKEKSCSLPYLFREAFASGKVFSSSMLDTLLYQSFIKDYLTTLLRIMLGLQYTAGSGYLWTYRIKEEEVGKTYHEIFRRLSRRNGCVVLGLFRYEEDSSSSSSLSAPSAVITISQDNDVITKNLLQDTSPVKGNKQRKESYSEEASDESTPKRRNYSNIMSMKRSKKTKFNSQRHQNLRKLHLIQSNKSERERLDEIIECRMKELQLIDKPYKSLSNKSNNNNRFGYILLNPSADVILQKDDILYVILPEMKSESSRSPSCLSYHSENMKSFDESSGEFAENQEKVTSSRESGSFTRENEVNSKLRRISAIYEEIDTAEAEVVESAFDSASIDV